jgi:putative membrane protein
MYWGYHYWGMHAFWWMFWVAIVVWLLFWPPRARAPRDSALETLRRRFAAGAIDDDEYRHRLGVLRGEKADATGAEEGSRAA